MREVFIVAAKRTPIGRFGGSLVKHSAVDLAAHVIEACVKESSINPADLDLFAFGQVLRAGQGQLIPRQAAIKAGIPDSVDGFAVDMVCSSGMMSTMLASTMIKAGEADLILAGGTESMSGAGFFLSSRARWGYKYLAGAPEQVVDILAYDGLTDPFSGEAMGLQTEKLAAEHGIGREELDAVAAESHRRAAAATDSGAFEAEIAPIAYRDRREEKTLQHDEGIRSDTSTESLSKLRPAFTKDGVLTAGNSSQISDGAAALLLASSDAVEKFGLTPIGKLGASSWAAGEPYKFPEAPIPAVRKALDKSGMKLSDVDLFENNEAFAINNLLFSRMLDVDPAVVNIHGGAIAMGHPIGCSGARIMITLLHALRQKGHNVGMASICHGTGGGTAVVVEAV